ncbi:GNAT family N-acetyltransferase [Paenibacillus sp. MMS18-CY102]|uniref:GNAT family N-acetyltransferase n=1 Tax=Paenibacillus sp. MMS18-CY102 TaxID=2682849 RepID=UPI00136570DE|nr:GNAT family N-acetyltransferase [Paenibacillus sp. MMS18-CY102]MWC31246.1 GNAT family N-acetyltransferase [Paenibacillus sp. MMS18-CY102]
MQGKVEELMMNAWPALRTVMVDGWVARFSNGYTKRANAVYPMYNTGIEADWQERIAVCERLYAEQGQPVIFKLTDAPEWLQLDEQLAGYGYSEEGRSVIMAQTLDSVPEPSLYTVEMSVKPTDRWIAQYLEMSEASDPAAGAAMKQILNGIMPLACFFTLYDGDQNVACGSAVLERGYVGLYDIATAPAYRNQGYGEQLVLNMLKWAKLSGAQQAYLAVVSDNAPAVRLYGKTGFKPAYRYWYRTLATS